jgi:hypothetical protein
MHTIAINGGNRLCLLAVLGWFVVAGTSGNAQEGVATTAVTNAPAARKVLFRPPATGAPAVRVTGGSRGVGELMLRLDVLAPDDIGKTVQEQPSLFWYQSMPAEARFELTLLQEEKVEPLVRVAVERAAKAGIQRLRLSEHGVRLQPGVEYQWVVALIHDPDNRSTDLVASGVILRVEPGEELRAKIRSSTPSALPGVYAEAGIWYDALSALSDHIEAHPEDAEWRALRRDLLGQVGLKGAGLH